MQVVKSREGSVTIIKPTGPIVAGELDELDQAFNDLAVKWTKRVAVNMSDVTFLDSAGLELLVRHQKQMSEHGLKMKLSHLSEMTRKIMDITQISRLFEIYPDTATAVRSYL